MQVGWLIDASVFDAYHAEFVAACRRNGCDVVSVNRPSPPYRWDDTESAYRQAFPAGSCVVTHADIDLVNRVVADRRWIPGAFATVRHFFCSHYFPHLSEFLLNRDHLLLPFSELEARAAELFERFGHDGKIFVRPDSPLKLFTGLIVSKQTLREDLEFMAFYEFPRDSALVVSSPKAIAREWRFVVADHEVVAASLYMERANLVSRAGAPAEARSLAETIAASPFEPDPVWVLDVCETTDGEFRLLEVGGFSFASWYACDKDAIIQAASRVALRLYEADAKKT